jgi:hypothetical protein
MRKFVRTFLRELLKVQFFFEYNYFKKILLYNVKN